MTRLVTGKVICLDGGTHHSWWKLGLDVVNGKLRRLRRCVWCGVERTVAY